MQNAMRLFIAKSPNVRLELENYQKCRIFSPAGFESDDTLSINLEEKCQYEYICYFSSTKKWSDMTEEIFSRESGE